MSCSQQKQARLVCWDMNYPSHAWFKRCATPELQPTADGSEQQQTNKAISQRMSRADSSLRYEHELLLCSEPPEATLNEH